MGYVRPSRDLGLRRLVARVPFVLRFASMTVRGATGP
jgi:hypothetical protein